MYFLRNDILNDRISKDSPLGKAIIGHKVGDSVKIALEDGYSYFVKILDLTKGIDDDTLRINWKKSCRHTDEQDFLIKTALKRELFE